MGEVQGPFAFCGRPVHTQSVSLSKEEDELAFGGITAYDEVNFQAGQVNIERADFRRYKDSSNRVRDHTRKDCREHLEEITKDLPHDQSPSGGV